MASLAVVVAAICNFLRAVRYVACVTETVSVMAVAPERSTRVKFVLPKEACFTPAVHRPPEESLVISCEVPPSGEAGHILAANLSPTRAVPMNDVGAQTLGRG